MAVTLLHGTGNLACDSAHAGAVEFSIARPEEGPGTYADTLRRLE